MLHQSPSSQLQHKRHILLLLSQHHCLQVGHQGIVSKKIFFTAVNNVIRCYYSNFSKKRKRETYIFACTIAVESEK